MDAFHLPEVKMFVLGLTASFCADFCTRLRLVDADLESAFDCSFC